MLLEKKVHYYFFPVFTFTLVALRKFVDENGGVFVMPENEDTEHILQYNGKTKL